ncbi:MAG: hypothetical protein AAF502_19080 [Bacteroidota bacterium]
MKGVVSLAQPNSQLIKETFNNDYFEMEFSDQTNNFSIFVYVFFTDKKRRKSLISTNWGNTFKNVFKQNFEYYELKELMEYFPATTSFHQSFLAEKYQNTFLQKTKDPDDRIEKWMLCRWIENENLKKPIKIVNNKKIMVNIKALIKDCYTILDELNHLYSKSKQDSNFRNSGIHKQIFQESIQNNSSHQEQNPINQFGGGVIKGVGQGLGSALSSSFLEFIESNDD